MVIFNPLRATYAGGQIVEPKDFYDAVNGIGTPLSSIPRGEGPFLRNVPRKKGALGWARGTPSARVASWSAVGVWCDGSIPFLAFPWLWNQLRSATDPSEIVETANQFAADLESPEDPSRVFSRLPKVDRPTLARLLHDLFVQKEQVGTTTIKVDLSVDDLDLIPWIFLLGPLDPFDVQVLPFKWERDQYWYTLGDKISLPYADVQPMLRKNLDKSIETLLEEVEESPTNAWQRAIELRKNPLRVTAIPTVEAPAYPNAQRPQSLESLPLDRDPLAARTIVPQNETGLPPPWPIERILLVAIAISSLITVWMQYNARNALDQLVSRTSTDTNASAKTDTSTTDTITPATDPTLHPRAPLPNLAHTAAMGLLYESPVPIAKDARSAFDQAIAVRNAKDMTLISNAAVEVALREKQCVENTPIDGMLDENERKEAAQCVAMKSERFFRGDGTADVRGRLQWLVDYLERQSARIP